MHTHTAETRERLTPADALQILKDGNARFRANLKANRNLLEQVNETSDGQWPFAVVLSCIDSRTSTELVFDQGLGDIFSVRIAGNFLNDDILASMEFACHVAGAKLVVVLGHSHCGAIKGACDRVELGLLSGMLRKIMPSVDAVAMPVEPAERSSANADFVDAVSRENVLRSTQGILKQSDVLRTMHEAGEIDVVGGMYDVATGSVEFFSGAVESGERTRGENVLTFPKRGKAVWEPPSEGGEWTALTQLEGAADPASRGGRMLISNSGFLDDVQEALGNAPNWKAWTQSANARSLALVIVGLACIGPASELIRYGRIDFQSGAMMGTAALLLIAGLCWRFGMKDAQTPEIVQSIHTHNDTRHPKRDT